MVQRKRKKKDEDSGKGTKWKGADLKCQKHLPEFQYIVKYSAFLIYLFLFGLFNLICFLSPFETY